MIAPPTLDATSACDQPPENLTVEQAHAIMQQHTHTTARCPQRKAALALLVKAGHYRLAS